MTNEVKLVFSDTTVTLENVGGASAADVSTSIAAAVGSDALSVVYVGKQGIDANDGLKIGESKLTLASAVTQAAALITAGAAKAVVRVMDSGTYTENIVLPDNVILRAEAATLVGSLTLDPGAEAYIDRHFPASGSTVMVDALEASGDTSHYSARVMDGRGIGGALTGVDLFRNASSGRVLMVDVGVGFVPQGGIGLRDQSAGGFGHIHFNCKDIYLAGNNAQAIRTNNANTNIIGYVDHVLEFGTPTGTVAFDLRDAGSIVKITASEIIADSAWVITAGALYINCPKITGTQTGTATIVNGQTPDINAGLAAANAPTALNPFATMADAAGVTNPLTLGTPGSSDGQLILASDNREDYAAVVFQADFGGNPDPGLFIGYNPPHSTGYNIAEQSIFTGYEGYYWVGAGTQYVEWYVEYRAPGGTPILRPFQSSIEINTDAVNTYIYGDTLVFGAGDGTPVYFQIINGAAAFTVPFGITGQSDTIQMQLTGYPSQAASIFVIERSTGDDLLTIDSDGHIVSTGYAAGTADWVGFNQTIHSTTSTYTQGIRSYTLRDGAGPNPVSYTTALETGVFVRASSVDAFSGFANAGIFSINLEAASGKTSWINANAYIIQAVLNKSGLGTKLVGDPHGVHIGDMGGTGSYRPMGLYIESQSAATSGVNYAIYTNLGPVHFGDDVDLASGKVYKVNAVQVVGARVVDARCDDTINSGDATTDGVIDALRDAMIAHGLIAAA